MCIIVDANRVSVFLDKQKNESRPIHDWLSRGHGAVVYGGKLTEELSKNDKMRRLLVTLNRAGQAKEISKADILEKLTALPTNIQSDDPHIIALAQASGSRLLYTHDDNLIEDFKNANLISSPRGKIYKREENANLLTQNVCGR